ncbi:MAG: sulfite exporter TauE/SafE family protein [Acidobacteria bacterium]|jgi:sulfite exporter TauE/SafE|nr:sulfite exporter TauE/SafE family protein [Acidobacteriota bacterium]
MSEILLLMFSTSTAAVLSLGFVLGLKHAVEADHLAAVSTIVTERRSLFSSAIVGGLWGLGHTISLFIAGVLVLLLDFQISEQTERALEFGVGIMLVLLGLNVLQKIVQGGTLHFHTHEHGKKTHVHPHLHERGKENDPESHHGLSISPRAVVIGMIHGLAGSAALMLLVIPTIDSTAMGLLYILIFGIGSIGGMMLMSFLVGLPFQITALRFNRLNLILQCVAGLISVGLGLFIIYEKGVVEGLFA